MRPPYADIASEVQEHVCMYKQPARAALNCQNQTARLCVIAQARAQASLRQHVCRVGMRG